MIEMVLDLITIRQAFRIAALEHGCKASELVLVKVEKSPDTLDKPELTFAYPCDGKEHSTFHTQPTFHHALYGWHDGVFQCFAD